MELGAGAAPWAWARLPQPVPATAERSLGVCSGDTRTRRVPAAGGGRAGLGRAARRARVVPAHPWMSCRARSTPAPRARLRSFERRPVWVLGAPPAEAAGPLG